MNKIEAAEALANAWDMLRRGDADWCDVNEACSAYRSASVPSDRTLACLAERAYAEHEGGMNRWVAAAAAVREWVQRDSGVKLTDEERAVIVAAMQSYLIGDPNCEPARSILRKLGHEPEPVWEWDEANATMTLGGKFSDGVFPCAAVSLFYGGGLLCRIHLSEMKELHQVLDNYAESLEWCEQQLREARQ